MASPPVADDPGADGVYAALIYLLAALGWLRDPNAHLLAPVPRTRRLWLTWAARLGDREASAAGGGLSVQKVLH